MFASRSARARAVALAVVATVAAAALWPACDKPAAADDPARGGPRVVSLTPALCGLIDALGRRDTLVGVTRHCDLAGVEVIGDMRPDAERILARRPTLVVAAAYPSTAPDREALRAQGLNVLELPLTTLADLRAALRTLGERLDAPAAAARLVGELDGALAAARAAAAKAATPPLKTLLVFDIAGGHVYTTGGQDHLAEVLAAVGADNVAAGGPVTARLPLERIISLAPDVIIHTHATADLPDEAAARAFWARMPTLPAVRSGRIYVWPDSDLAQPGRGLAAAIERLTALLQGAP